MQRHRKQLVVAQTAEQVLNILRESGKSCLDQALHVLVKLEAWKEAKTLLMSNAWPPSNAGQSVMALQILTKFDTLDPDILVGIPYRRAAVVLLIHYLADKHLWSSVHKVLDEHIFSHLLKNEAEFCLSSRDVEPLLNNHATAYYLFSNLSDIGDITGCGCDMLSTIVPGGVPMNVDNTGLVENGQQLIMKNMTLSQIREIAKSIGLPNTDISVSNSIIIDGGNVIYHGIRSYTIDGFRRLMLLVNKLKSIKLPQCKEATFFGPENIYVVLHQRHGSKECLLRTLGRHTKEALDIIKRLESISQVVWTPPGRNDDHFSIDLALSGSGNYIVTNDKFRDHFRESLGLKIWLKEHIVNYQINDKVNLIWPLSYSVRIQRHNNDIYVPSTDSVFYVLSTPPSSKHYVSKIN
jgi:hypothetical protein